MNQNNLPVQMKTILDNPAVLKRLEKRLGEKAGTFMTSVLDLCSDDKNLAICDPNKVIAEALKAAALDLPINKNLGFAYVIPYKGAPQFQMGYKGYIQLAIRTGQYRHLNADVVYEGEIIVEDRIKGTLKIEGTKTSDNVIGYFCYLQLINGFEKAVIWTKERVTNHAKKYSKNFNYKSSPWKTNFDSMAIKTLVLQLIPKYGIMNIEMSTAMANDQSDFKGFEGTVEAEIKEEANTEMIDITPKKTTDGKPSELEKKEIQAREIKESKKDDCPF